jgi:di/tricarboxylate transporter
MTPEILLVLGILMGAMVLFVTGFLRMDLTALLVLAALALTGLVTPTEALSGFSSSAVITVAGMFVISAGLGRTGIAGIVGRQVLKMAGTGEARLIVVIMVTAGLLSSVMNNIGVAAMMLPVVMDIARRTRRPPSRLLLPLALACLMGGLLTLVGTPPNILVSDALLVQGLEPFQLFDFTPIGLVILGVGIAFVALFGRHLLPSVDPRGSRGSGDPDLVESYALEERIFSIRLPRRTLLDGTTLAESRLGSALGLHVLAIDRAAGTGRRRRPQLAPGPGDVLRGGDRLIVQGLPDLLDELRHARHLELEEATPDADELVSREIGFAEAEIPDGSALSGQTLNRADLRQWSGAVVLAIRRGDEILRAALEDTPLAPGDALLLQGQRDHLDALGGRPEFEKVRRLTLDEALDRYELEDRFFTFRITPESILAGRTLRDSRLGDAAGLTVLGIRREGETVLVPGPDEVLHPDDLLLVKTHPDTLVVLRGLQRLEIEEEGDLLLEELDSEKVGLLEVVLSPRTKLMGSTPRQIGFRDKYGLTVLALWRAGQVFRTNLRDKPLEFGDSLLVFGPRDRLELLARDPDFLVLTESLQEPPRSERAPLSLVVLLATLGPVLMGWVPIGVAVLLGATLMVLTQCLTANEAYRSIEWPAVVLIAGMLPLGIAMDRTGAARMLAEQVVGIVGQLGPRGVLAGLCIMTAIGAQMIPSVALVVVMAPIALTTAADLGISPHTLMMGVALSAASLSSPVAHPANVLVMGPGGYRYMDYVKLGAPLTVIVLILVIFLLPVLLPFHP